MRSVLAAVAVLLAGLAGYSIGLSQAGRSGANADDVKKQLADADSKYAEEIARLRTQRDIADASNRELQKSLKQLQDKVQDEAAATSLYERIEGVDTGTGLAVDTVSKIEDENGTLTELHITLIQARGRERVSGEIGVALIGEKNESNWREVIVQVDSDKAPRFDMRFFQTLVVPVPSNDILIDIVEIDVKPRGKRHKPFKHEVIWSGISQE